MLRPGDQVPVSHGSRRVRNVPERPRLEVETRSLHGKKVRRLRRDGVIPANVMERHRPSQAIQVPERQLATLVRHGGGGHLVDLVWDGDTQPVLVDHIEVDAVSNRLLHATFRRVDLTTPIQVMVAVELQGTAPASALADLAVIQTLTEIEVTALPTEIPSVLIADISGLEFLGDEVTVGDLRAEDGRFEPATGTDETVIGVQATRVAAEDEKADLAAAELEEIEVEAAEGEAAVPDGETDGEATAPDSGGPQRA
jgi:large subunit ribosomal protein L25